MYEQLKLQNSELDKGSAHYQAIMADLSKLTASRDALVKNMDEIMNDISA